MRARLVLWVGLCFALSGCLLPTPVSILTSGLDAVSFVASGKTVADHGVSLVMGEDCALVRVLDGTVCREDREFTEVARDDVLSPLPMAGGELLVAGAHPEVVASATRIAAFDGWSQEDDPTQTRPADNPQFAMLSGGFMADDISPAGYVQDDPVPQTGVLLASAAAFEPATDPVVIPRRRPAGEAVDLAQPSFVGSDWPTAGEGEDLAMASDDDNRAVALLDEEAPQAPIFGTASLEFGERLTVVRYGALGNLTDGATRRVAVRRWGTEFEG